MADPTDFDWEGFAEPLAPNITTAEYTYPVIYFIFFVSIIFLHKEYWCIFCFGWNIHINICNLLWNCLL
jgi:hypothetical protein